MPTATISSGVEICYEVIDPPPSAAQMDERPLLLVQGLGGQLISWDDDFCAELVGRGFRVIRFDNRDVGLSTKFDAAGFPPMASLLAGDVAGAAYGVADMADDTSGLLDVLGFGGAHVVGVSMGGMIAQTLAIRHPAKVASLTSIMSTTGNRNVGAPTPEGLQVIFTPPPSEREALIDAAITSWRVLWGSKYPLEEGRIRTREGRQFDRCHHPEGVARQVAAIIVAADRTKDLGGVSVPALVVHGDEDPLIGLSGGEATAAAIPGAELLVMPGVGHSLPKPVWSQVCDAIAATARRANEADARRA